VTGTGLINGASRKRFSGIGTPKRSTAAAQQRLANARD
jgi:hypothetical protein